MSAWRPPLTDRLRGGPALVRMARLHRDGTRPASRRIDPGDGMFAGNETHYFGVGASAVRAIGVALLAAGRDPETVRRILDLPSGYGRVLRNLRSAFPDAEITACDLLADGVAFCAREFGAVPVVSHEDLARVELGGGFDLVWCGSLLTHVDAPRWRELLDFFEGRLAPGGMLVFTTHGRIVPMRFGRGWDYGFDVPTLKRLVASYRDTGFAYSDYPGQSGYGLSLASPVWTLALVAERAGLKVVSYAEAGWDGHQDVVACVAAPLAPPPGKREEEFRGIDFGLG